MVNQTPDERCLSRVRRGGGTEGSLLKCGSPRAATDFALPTSNFSFLVSDF
jgi:hypothetical protein